MGASGIVLANEGNTNGDGGCRGEFSLAPRPQSESLEQANPKAIPGTETSLNICSKIL